MSWKGTIPIYINNYNRLATTKNLAEYFDDIPKTEVIIIDNKSTYPPLLEWYNKNNYKVIRLKENIGWRACWKVKGIIPNPRKHKKKWGSQYYIVTDPDLDFSGIPKDCIELFVHAIEHHPNKIKCGPGLEINDLPALPFKREILDAQEKYWKQQTRYLSSAVMGGRIRFYEAMIDTTFAVYRYKCDDPFNLSFNSAIRADRPYVAKHMPWYLTKNNITEEDIYWAKQKKICGRWGPIVGEYVSKNK